MPVWLAPLLLAALLALAFLVIQSFAPSSSKRRSLRYRRSYLEMVGALERQTVQLNRLSASLSFVKGKELIEAYEGCLRVFENLLIMVQKIAPFGMDGIVLDSAHYLIDDFDTRLAKTEKAIKSQMQGKLLSTRELAAHARDELPLGCYFCSRPFIYAGLSKVRAKIEGKTRQVYSCTPCRDELNNERKVRILYFIKEGAPLHWSKVPEYNPLHDFWDLQRQNMVMKTSKLELIYTRDPHSDPHI